MVSQTLARTWTRLYELPRPLLGVRNNLARRAGQSPVAGIRETCHGIATVAGLVSRSGRTMPVRPPVHRPLGARTDAERRASRDAGPSPSRIYGRRWQKLRRLYLDKHPLCECGCGHPATVVDHRTPHLGDHALIYDWNNLQALTKPCHDRKTASRDGGFGNPIKQELQWRKW